MRWVLQTPRIWNRRPRSRTDRSRPRSVPVNAHGAWSRAFPGTHLILELWRYADLAVLISQACLSRHFSEMMDRIAKGPEDVKKSVRAADELP
jgi:hypothetical protein